MTKRWILTSVAVAAVVVVTAGVAYAAGKSDQPSSVPVGPGMMATHDAMHDSPAMVSMRSQMPEALQEQCDAMHAQMDQMMGSSGGTGMMGGFSGDVDTGGAPGTGGMTGGMMGGSGMMGSSGMAAHYPTTSTG